MPFLRKEGIMNVVNEPKEEYKENSSSNVEYCTACKSPFVYQPEDTWFDEKCVDYSTKLVRCKNCGKPVVIKRIKNNRF